VSLSYDLAGALVSTSEGLAIDYNIKGQTTEVTPPGGSAIDMSYQDADQTRRHTAGSLRYATSQLGLQAEVDGSQGIPHTTYFLRDPGGTLLGHRERGGPAHHYILDALGSVVGVTDGSGALVATYHYEPYGEISGTTGQADITPFRFASGYLDQDIGWTKFGTRYHEPSRMLRWTQVDPERGNVENPITLNPYLYVGCSPVNVTDPTGRIGLLAAALIGLGIGIGVALLLEALGVGSVASAAIGGCLGGVAGSLLAGATIAVAPLACIGGGLFGAMLALR
jgi:RHS repeat-associated protein